MFKHSKQQQYSRILVATVCACIAIVASWRAGDAAAATAANIDPPDLGTTPPDISSTVAPNILVTFDDSGSMAGTTMGDNPPSSTWSSDLTCTGRGCTAKHSAGALINSNYGWGKGPWACAGIVDPTGNSGTIASYTMNGVYFNPGITYTPPSKEDGTSLLTSDSTYQGLTAVPLDGLALNRPSTANKITAGSVGFNNNPNLGGQGSDSGLTDLTGTLTTETIFQCTTKNGTGGNNCLTTGTPTKTQSSDNRWKCGAYDVSNGSPMDGTSKSLSDGTSYQYGTALASTTSNCAKNVNCCVGTSCSSSSKLTTVIKTVGGGGPYYYRLKKTVSVPLIASGLGAGTPTCGTSTAAKTVGPCDSGTGVANLYTVANWEAVPIIDSTDHTVWKNVSLWYAFYRARNLMARTSLSRVFGAIGGPNGSSVRVAWQNMGNNPLYNTISGNQSNGPTTWPGCDSGTHKDSNGNNTNNTCNFNALNGLLKIGTDIITTLDDTAGATFYTQSDASKVGYRQAFFNWIYNVTANQGTPSRDAVVKAGAFFSSNGTNVDCTSSTCAAPTTAAAKASDPYWENGSPGRELACRQNFHLLVTDGYWNGDNSDHGSGSYLKTSGNQTFPDGVKYTGGSTGKTIYTIYNGADADSSGSSDDATMSNIAFNYWAKNLRPDLVQYNSDGSLKSGFTDTVPPYFTDTTVGVTATAAAVVLTTPPGTSVTPEIYFNPVNDPATWPHMVNFMVTLGAGGVLNAQPDDPDCLSKGFDGTVGTYDYCNLRKGTTGTAWPASDGTGSGIPANVDDIWHAALNSRGAFFVATNPADLVSHLSDILNSVAKRAGQSSAASVSSSILSGGAFGYAGGYDSSNWSGTLFQDSLDTTNGNATKANWDAGCIMTGGTFSAGHGLFGPNGTCDVPTPAPDQVIPNIYTAIATTGGGLTGVTFEKSSLGTTETTALGLDPNTTYQTTTGSSVVITGTADLNWQDRVDYLSGTRKYETATNANGAEFRARKSLLGAIVNSQVVYEGGPSAGWQDIYPAGDPEQVAAVTTTCVSTPSDAACHSYENYVSRNKTRTPLIYAGANDGMLHAFNASTGAEVWSYIPNMLYGNGQLNQLTNANNKLVNTVDATPVIQDVFLKDKAWHTILVGSMRLGGRGIYALDITDATANGATNKFKWEFTDQNDALLGYTYSSANIARLHNGKWVVLLSSGYFPGQLPIRQNGTHSIADTISAASANQTHLWVLDANDGTLIKRLDTPTTVTSFGLSTPDLVDFGGDQIDDIAVAGDLAGNLWRFDLSNADSTKWKVDQMFTTYPKASTDLCSSAHPTGIGCEPISVMPVAFPDSVTGSVVYVFGSGKYLGTTDHDSTNQYTNQHFFGVRDYGQGSANYPIQQSDLQAQTLTQASGVRSLTNNAVGSDKRGWEIAMSLVTGERDVVTAVPLFSSGAAILTSLFPPADDPCSTERSGAIIAVNAGTGGPLVPPGTAGGSSIVGGTVDNPPIVGSPSVISLIGGGSILIPGLTATTGTGKGAPPQFPSTIWRRSSWRELLNNL